MAKSPLTSCDFGRLLIRIPRLPWFGLIAIGLFFADCLENVTVAVAQPPKTVADGRQEAVDLYGDPLPAGAVLRLGTVRLRQAQQDRTSVSYSSNGKLLASSEGDAVVLWNATIGQRLRAFRSRNARGNGRPGNVVEVAFAPRTEELAASYADGKVVVWDVNTGDETLLTGDDFPQSNPLEGECRGLAYSPNGTLLAANHARSTFVFDRMAGQIVQRLGADGDPAQYGLCWSPKDTYIGRGSRIALARLWDISGGKGHAIRDLKADIEGFALSLAISHDGRMLAAGCIGNGRKEIMICLWQLPSGRLKTKLPSGDAVSIHFTPDDKTLISATEMGSIDIWDVGTGVLRQTIPSGLGVIRTAALAPDGKTVAIGAVAPEIGQWDVETGQKKLAEFVGHGREVHSVAFSPDGEVIATLAENGDIRLWDAVTGKQRRQMKSSYRAHLAFDPTGKQLAACGRWSGEVNVWNVRTGEQTFVLNPGEKSVRRAGFTADGKYVVAVGSNPRDGSSARDLITDRFHIWDATTGRHVRDFEFTAGITESMLFLPGSRSVVLGAVYGAESKGMRVFDLETGAETGVAIGHEATVYSLAYGNGLVASGSQDKTVRLWDATTWKQIAVLTGHDDHVISVAFSPDGKWLASGDLAGIVRVWNVETRKQIYELPNQGYGVLSLCLSPTGDRIVTAMQNGTALVWTAPFSQ